MSTKKSTVCWLALGSLAFALGGHAGIPAQKTVDPSTAGEISGSVKLDGKAPKMRTIDMNADAFCVKAHPTPATAEQVVTGEGGSLANVLIYVKSGLEGYSFPAPSTPVKLDQKGCQYHPHVIGVQTGQNVEMVNSDQTAHNIHGLPTANREWNESQPPGSAPIDKSFARAEIAITVKCNVHPWMKSYIAVVPHPYFQVTGNDGAFDLKNLPPGTYTLVAWHESYGTSEQTVTIGPKETKKVTFTLNAY